MRSYNIVQISHRWLIACAVVAMLAVAAATSAFDNLSADDPCEQRCQGEIDCRGSSTLRHCGAVWASTCCEWGPRFSLPVAEVKTAPNYRPQDRPLAPFALDVKSLWLALAYTNLTDFKPEKGYSAGAGTETYLVTARLRI